MKLFSSLVIPLLSVVVVSSLEPTCLVDDVDNRQLPTDVCDGGTGLCAYLTIRVCAEECRKLGLAIAGVEAGHACSCGDELSIPNATVDLSECDSPCLGNSSETCGASPPLQIRS